VELGSSICVGDVTPGFLREADREESPFTQHWLLREGSLREGSLRELSWFQDLPCLRAIVGPTSRQGPFYETCDVGQSLAHMHGLCC